MSTSDSETAEVLLSLRGISKSFGQVQALTDVSLDVPEGKVTALIGDNGSGKSTLIKTIAGLWSPDSGEIHWRDKRVHISTPRDAEELGIKTIYQDLALCDNLDIVGNMFLGHEEMTYKLLDEGKMEGTALKVLEQLQVVTVKSVRQLAESLSGGQRQSVAVAKAVMTNARLVIMDEPTAALGVVQTRVVLELVKRLSSSGVAVLMISHNLNDVFAVADRIAVMYLGRLVVSGPASGFNRQNAVEYMTTGTAAQTVDVA